MMDKLIEEIKLSVEREYGRAGSHHGLINHSDHESYALILEELQEAKMEVDAVEHQLSAFWGLVMHDESDLIKYSRLTQMQNNAILAACEMIQVAAMVKKAAMTVCERGAQMELKGE